MYLRFFNGLLVSFYRPFKKAAKLAPFSGDSPLPNVLVTTNNVLINKPPVLVFIHA